MVSHGMFHGTSHAILWDTPMDVLPEKHYYCCGTLTAKIVFILFLPSLPLQFNAVFHAGVNHQHSVGLIANSQFTISTFER